MNLTGGLNHFSELWAVALQQACWQGGCALAIAWLTCHMMPRLAPGLRTWLWRLAYLKLLSALVLIPAQASLRLPLLPASVMKAPATVWRQASSPSSPVALPAQVTQSADAVPPRLLLQRAIATPRATPSLSFTSLIFLCWLAVAITSAGRIGREWLLVRRLRAGCKDESGTALSDCCSALAWRFDLSRAPLLLSNSHINSPLLIGTLQPAVVLPDGLLKGCSAPELRLLLAHEVAHLKRRDLWWGWLPALCQTVFFFHPLVWLGAREWRLTQEMACDDMTVRIADAALSDYGGVLLKVAEQCRPHRRVEFATVAGVETYDTLKTRLLAMKRFCSAPAPHMLPVSVLVGLLGISGLLPWRVVARVQANGPTEARSGRPDLGINASLHGRRPLPDDNPWNTPVEALPVDAASARLIASIGLNQGLHADFGAGADGLPYGIPYVVVSGHTPRVPMSFHYAAQSDPGPYPIPPMTPVERNPQSNGDQHLVVLDRDNWKLYELWSPLWQGNRWHAVCGANFDLNSNAVRPANWTSATGAGLPAFPGLVRFDEAVELGQIRHALIFMAKKTGRAYVYPARHFASLNPDRSLPPMGLRVRLKKGFDIAHFPPQSRAILQALKIYGMFLSDNGESWHLSGTPDARWNDTDLHSLDKVTGRDLEVVQMDQLTWGPAKPAKLDLPDEHPPAAE